MALLGGLFVAIWFARLELGIARGSLTFIASLVVSGGLWGYGLAKATNQDYRRLTAVGAAVWGIIVFVFAVLLEFVNAFTGALVEVFSFLPPHLIFTIPFVVSTFVISSTASFAMAKAMGRAHLARRAGIQSGAVAAVAFLITDLVLLSQGLEPGVRVAGRSGMLTVAFSGLAAAAFLGGGALGWVLSDDGSAERMDSGEATESAPGQSIQR